MSDQQFCESFVSFDSVDFFFSILLTKNESAYNEGTGRRIVYKQTLIEELGMNFGGDCD